jgi:voltage-gated potassium channel
MMNPTRRLLRAGILLLLIIIIGVAGYRLIEGWSLFDALYMTVITITTVGYKEVYPLSIGGRVFTILLIVGGIGGAFYALFGIIEYIVEGQFGMTLGRRRMKTRIANLKEHFILSGFDRFGEEIANTFKAEGVPFVIIENRPDFIARAEHAGYIYLEGDGTKNEVLQEAGIDRARGLVAALASDVDNTYITLSARGLHPTLFIAARASDVEAEKKLRLAGANRIVSPDAIGGRRAAMLALHPAVVDFLDIVTSPNRTEIEMEKVAVNDTSSLNGQTVKDIRQCSSAVILAINKKNGELLPNPPEDEKIVSGDSLIIMGSREQLGSVEAVCQGKWLNTSN